MTPYAKNLLGIPKDHRVKPRRLIRKKTLKKFYFRKWKFKIVDTKQEKVSECSDSDPHSDSDPRSSDDWILFPERGVVNDG